MEKKNKLSVLMTVYNEEEYIKEAIKSVLNQSFRNFEFIIVDDGSTDNTKRVIKSFKDDRIKYYYTGKNKGFTNLDNIANFGIKKCKGKYIARIDADDICLQDRFKIQIEYLDKHFKIFMIGGGCDIIDENGDIIDIVKKRSYPSILNKYHILNSNSFIHSSIMFRNESLSFPFYPHWRDVYLYINMIREGKRLKNIPNKLVQYRINSHSIIGRQNKLGQERERERKRLNNKKPLKRIKEKKEISLKV